MLCGPGGVKVMRAAISRTDCSNCMCMKGAPTQEVVGSAAVEPNQCSREGAADVCSEESSLASHVRVGRVGCDSRSTFTWCALTVLLRDGYLCSGQCVLCVCVRCGWTSAYKICYREIKKSGGEFKKSGTEIGIS